MISFPAFFSLFLNFCLFIVSRFSSLCVLTHSLSQPVFRALLNLSEIMTLTKSPPVPLCQAQPPTVDPAIETTTHDIIRARPTHGRNKRRPTFTPKPTRCPTFPNCIRDRILSYSSAASHAQQNVSQAGVPNWGLKTNRWIHGTLPVMIIIVITDARPNH